MTVPVAANITGDPIFPHNGDVATDVTISSPTTWTNTTYPGRVVQLNRLDVDDVLTLQGGPWFIFVETLDMGASGEIRGDGPDGSLSALADDDYALGAYVSSTGVASGGCGGVMVFIIANSITGTASRPISANGGAGSRNTSNAGSTTGRAGEGAFDRIQAQSVTSQTYGSGVQTFLNILGDGGGGATIGGRAGGTGGVTDSGGTNGGGSGIGGGAGASTGSTSVGFAPRNEPSVVQLLELALAGCLGGGGGAAVVTTTGTNNAAGGGGGGSVVVWYATSSADPTLTATGGASVGGTNDGADGVTYYIQVP